MVATPPKNGSELAELLKGIMDDIAVQTENEVSDFREALSDEAKLDFDAMSNDKRMIAVGLSRRTRNELAVLTKSSCYFSGLHDFGGTLNLVMNGVPELIEKGGKQ